MKTGNGSKDMWVGIGKQVISFVVGVIATAFILGSARQRVNDLSHWKNEIGPRIERMDSKGTISFEIFHREYEKTQARQEGELKELEKEIRTLEKERNKP